MRLVHEARDRVAEAQLLIQFPGFDNRPIKFGLLKGISETVPQLIEYRRSRMKRDRTAERLGDRPQLVDPVAMIAMRVGNDHAVEPRGSGREQLLTKVGAAIDKQRLLAAFDQDRGAQPAIARLIRIALAPSLPIFGTPVEVPQPRMRILTRLC